MRALVSSFRPLHLARASTLALLFACSGNDDTVLENAGVEGPTVEGATVDGSASDTAEPSLGDMQASELDGYIEEAMRRYQVPGTALAIVRGSDVVYQGTFGVRGVDDPRPITPDTRFAVGSVTKPMTTLMAATLVDDGELSWDARATDVLPAFALSDPASTPRIRVRDLFNGTSGVPRFDTPFMVHAFTPTELVSLVETIPTVAPPGDVFGYSNAMVSVGGYLAAVAAGAPYDDAGLTSTYTRLMQDRIFSPIGMSDTTLDIDAALAAPDHAWPHSFDGARGAMVQTPIEVERFSSSVRPAGGAWSSLRDMAAYASTQLSGVAPNGNRVVSRASLEQTHTQEIAELPSGEWPTADREGAGYAMGWFTMADYRGLRALSHDGNTMGFTAEVFLLPDADIAVVVLCNRAMANAFYGAVEQYAIETVLGLEHRGDELQAAQDQGLLDLFQSIGSGSVAVSREEAEPYLGSYDYGTRVDFTEAGFTLSTDFAPIPLSAHPDFGLFVRSGELTGMTVAAFDATSAPAQVTLGIPGGEGLSQPFVLRRLSSPRGPAF